MQIVAPDEKRAAILRTLGSLLVPTRAAAGCMQAHLYADVDKRKTLFLVEEWESREQFDRIRGELDKRHIEYFGPDRVENSLYFKGPDGELLEIEADPLEVMEGRPLAQ